MVIRHNISALNAHRMMGIHSKNVQRSLERLSSGYRINRAADDAAGLAISEKMRAQIRGLTMAERNVSHSMALIQTAEGGANEIHALLQRMRELAVQASNGTYTPEDRANIDREYQALMSEIDRISSYTNYNGIKLLDGSLFGGGSSRSSLQGISGASGIAAIQSPANGSTSVNWSNISGNDYSPLVSEMENSIVPQVINQMTETLSSLGWFADSNIHVGLNYSRGTDYAAEMSYSFGADFVELTLTINLDRVDERWDAGTGDFKSNEDRSRFEALVAHEMMHAVMDIATTAGMGGSSQFPQWFKEGMAQTMGGDRGWVTGTAGLSATSSDEDIKALLEQDTLTDGSSLSNYAGGYLAVMYLAHQVAGGGAITGEKLASGVNTILGELACGTSLDQVIQKHTGYTGLDDFEKYMSDQPDTYDFVRGLVKASGSGFGSVLTGDLKATDLVANTNAASNFLKLDGSNTKIRNQYPPGYAAGAGGGAYESGRPVHPSYNPGVLYSGKLGKLVLQVGANGSADQRLELTVESLNSRHLGQLDDNGRLATSVKDTDVLTRDNANAAIKVLDEAIKQVSSQRAGLGAMHNRLEYTLRNLGVSKENLIAAESAIRDVDMAKEMMEYTKNSILLQVAQAMMAQAMQLEESILMLLR